MTNYEETEVFALILLIDQELERLKKINKLDEFEEFHLELLRGIQRKLFNWQKQVKEMRNEHKRRDVLPTTPSCCRL